MNIETFLQLKKRQEDFFHSGATRPEKRRKQALKDLQQALRAREGQLLEAVFSDLHKSPYEAFMSELGPTFSELHHALKYLHAWMRPKRHPGILTQFPSKASTQAEPYGNVLILSPWNYPLQLSLCPLIGALAAGNTVILKPSAYAPATSRALADLLSTVFPTDWVSVVEGGRTENEALLDLPFDYLFFTGSPTVGQLVMQKASAHLTPLTLELGGKSPVIIDRSADLPMTARRILFGKVLNAGQTCVAPDYVLCPREQIDEFLGLLQSSYAEMIPSENYEAKNLPRIVNRKHYERLQGLLEGAEIVFSRPDCPEELQMGLRIVRDPDPQGPMMQEEIFGPILPVLPYDNLADELTRLRQLPKPLALYLFTQDRQIEKLVSEQISSGSLCINDTVVQVLSPWTGFGGVGQSGMGHYHGKSSFDTFSHQKTILKRSLFLDLPLRYHPYHKPDKQLPEILFHV